ncbi:MAG: hypothetical protein KC731_04770, partial [Myxococcales bacterium]|nr:hypothetical protein [Myxococcales bacterium]
MKNIHRMTAFAVLLLAAACQVGAEADDIDEANDEPVASEESATPGLAGDAPTLEGGDASKGDVLREIRVAQDIVRQVTPTSMEPTAEITTATGSYVAIWVSDDGTSTTFEGVPAGAKSALTDVQVDSPLELFVALAPEGAVPPKRLALGRTYSALEAEAAEYLAQLPPEQLVLTEWEAPAPPPGQQQALAVTTCSKDQANDLYDNFRPGVLDSSEGALEFTASNFEYREARRRKDYQAFFQTNFNQWTPTQPPGGIQAAYFRATASICTGAARLTMFRCLGNQATANNGCGASGSTIAATFGPFSMASGGIGTFKDWPGGDIARARLDQMSSSSDHAI